MIIDDGPFPQGYHDQAGAWAFYDPERAQNRGQLRGVGNCYGCSGVQLGRARGLGILGEPYDTLLLGTATAIGVGTLVYLFVKRRKRRRR